MRKVQVLLSMHNDHAFLADQIDSLIWQELKPWGYVLRDAGSSDDCVAIAHRYDLRIAPEVVQAQASTPNAAAFAILDRASDGADLYAFCGGDDLWHEHKLRRAAGLMGVADETGPLLYCARARVVRADGAFVGLTPRYPGRLSLLRLLFEPAVIGPTIVVNKPARDLLRAARLVAAPFWPWAMALIVAARGGAVICDGQTVMDLRLHPEKWLATASSIADPTAATLFDRRVPFGLLARHIAALRGVDNLTDHAKSVLGAVEAALRDKRARRALADHPDLDGGPFWATLRLKRAISRGLDV